MRNKKYLLKLSWLLLVNLIALQLCGKSTLANTLEYWKFNPQQSRLEIITDDDIRPQAQVIGNPTRLVIDLPGIILEEPNIRQDISRFVQEVRIGQFNRQTTRIVVELAPEYSLRPGEVVVRGLAPNRWFIQLPKFQPISEYSIPENTSVAIAVPPPKPYPTSGLIIVIDPGHGGRDPGAIGIRGLQEKRIILSIGLTVAKLLKQQGIRVIMTRSDDRFVSLQGRVNIAEQAKATAFVSIHANSIGLNNNQVNGLETYYYDTGERLARTIHNSILRRLDIRDRGVRRARFYVLRKSSMPSTLIEVGFVTGRIDSQNLSNPTYRKRMAEAIANGILQYFR